MKADAPNIDGRLDPKVFLDWLSDMDNYFEWYDMSRGQQVWFAEMKLVDARLFWTNIEYQLERA